MTNYDRNGDKHMSYVAKKSTMTGFSLCSTLVWKSLSSWIVTMWLDDVTVLVWSSEADCRSTLDDSRWLCVETMFVDGVHVDSNLTGTHLDLRISCLVNCNVSLDAIAETQHHIIVTGAIGNHKRIHQQLRRQRPWSLRELQNKPDFHFLTYWWVSWYLWQFYAINAQTNIFIRKTECYKDSQIKAYNITQVAQLSQRDCAKLRVNEYFTKSLKVIRNATVE